MSTEHYLACHKCKKSIHVAQDGLSGYTFYRGETECMKALGRFLFDHAHHPLQLVYEQEYEDYREVEWTPNHLLGNPEEMKSE